MNSYVTLRNFTEPRESELGAVFQRMAEFLGEPEEQARVQFRILSGEEPLYWSLELEKKACEIRAERMDKPDLEIITRAETAWKIASGSLSPLEAFVQGKMRIRGDIELGRRLLKQLTSSEGELDIF